MNNIWNKRNLKPPMMASYTTKITKFPYSKDIAETLDLVQKYYKYQTKFHEAMLINQQILYLRHIQFRTDIGFQKLQKIKSAYNRMATMNVSALVTKILNSISMEKYNDSIQLPTQETFEYLLIKLMGLLKLLIRIVELSKEAAECFVKLTNLSFFVELTTMLLANLSDIYYTGSDMARKTINHYNILIKYYSALKPSKRKWGLPENFRFPENLDDFISQDESNVIKFKNLPKWNADDLVGLKVANYPKIHVNKLIQQTDIGCEVSRDEVDVRVELIKTEKKI